MSNNKKVRNFSYLLYLNFLLPRCNQTKNKHRIFSPSWQYEDFDTYNKSTHCYHGGIMQAEQWQI